MTRVTATEAFTNPKNAKFYPLEIPVPYVPAGDTVSRYCSFQQAINVDADIMADCRRTECLDILNYDISSARSIKTGSIS